MFQVQMPYTSPLLSGLLSGISAGRQLAMLPSQIKQNNALAALNQYKLDNPEFMLPAGPVGQSVGLDLIAKKYGINSPEYLNAQKMINAKTAQQMANAHYKALGGGAPTIAKLQFYVDYLKSHPNSSMQDAMNAMAAQNIGEATGIPSSPSPQPAQTGSVNLTVPVMPSLSSMINSGFSRSQPSPLASLMGQPSQPPQMKPPSQGQMGIPLQRTPVNASGLDNLQSSIIKDTVPTGIMQQRQYAKTASQIYNDTNQFIPDLAKYTTYQGSINNLVDNVKAKSGVDSPEYTSLLKVQQNLPILTNELRKMAAGQATDTETAIFKSLPFSTDLRNLTPSQLIATWQHLGNLMNEMSKGLKLSPAQVEQELGSETKVLSNDQLQGKGIGQNNAKSMTDFINSEIAKRQKEGRWK